MKDQKLEGLSEAELKVLAYDTLVRIQQEQSNLQEINKELVKFLKKP